MPTVLHVSFLWDDPNVNQRHSDYILAMGWVKAGWDVYYFDYRATSEEYGNTQMNTALYKLVMKIKPDLLWFTKSEGVSRRYSRRNQQCKILPQTIRQMKKDGYKGTVVHWFLDQRKDLFKSTLSVGKECDWFFHVAAGDRLKAYSDKMNTPSSFIAVPYEPTFLHPKPFKQRSIDLIWMGGAHKPANNHFEDIRYNLLKQFIDTGHIQHYFGCFGKEKISCPQYQNLLGSSQMGLSLYAFDRPLYFSNRLSHIIGSETALFSYDFKDRKKIFSDEEGVFFKDFDEMKKKRLYYKNNVAELSDIATNGHKVAKEYFSSSNVVKEILNTLRTGKSTLPFGQTENSSDLKYDIPYSTKDYGDIHYLDYYGHILSIDQFSTRPRQVVLDRNHRRAESIKQLHAQKQNCGNLTKRAKQRMVHRRPKML